MSDRYGPPVTYTRHPLSHADRTWISEGRGSGMTDSNIPYIPSYGNITRALQAIQRAQTPDRFTTDFLETKLGLKGGSARPVIPFLKKTGFLASDGTPTSLYKRFRNPAQTKKAAAEAVRIGFAPLYEINEYVHDLTDAELKGVIVQVTGLDEGSSTIKCIVGSFKALRAFADFDIVSQGEDGGQEVGEVKSASDEEILLPAGLNLGYTINLHLPSYVRDRRV
jgi:Family of unknown function (DUF5343)